MHDGGGFPELVTMSEDAVAEYEPGPDEACISIRARGEQLPSVPPAFAATFWLECDDDCFDGWQDRGRVLSEADADRVIAFVDLWRPRLGRLVIHCAAGVSRSVSMALALGDCYGVPDAYSRHPETLLQDRRRWPGYIPNLGVYERVRDAYGRSRPNESQRARDSATP